MSYSQKILTSEIVLHITNLDIKSLRACFEEHNIFDIAKIVDELSIINCLFFIRSLKADDAAELFEAISPEMQENIINNFSDEEVQKTIKELYASEIVDLVEELPTNITQRILKSVDPKKRAIVNQLLNYPEDCAGSYMEVDFVSLKVTDTVKQAIKKIKSEPDISVNQGTYYIVDKLNALVGEIDIKKIFFADGNKILENIMEINPICGHILDDRSKIADILQKYEIHDLPIVDARNKLVGIIGYEDVLDIFEEETTEDFQNIAGIQPVDKSYLVTSSWRLSKSRIRWLTLLMISATLSQFVLQIFQNAFAKNGTMSQLDPILNGPIFTAILVPILPVISGTAGNAGTQSITVIIRSLALGEITLKDYWRIIQKEYKASLIVGMILVFANLLRMLIYYWILFSTHHGAMNHSNSFIGISFYAWKSILSTSIALMAIVSLVKFIGASLPILALRLKIDPTVAAAPLLTTLTDAISTTIFFAISFGIFLLI